LIPASSSNRLVPSLASGRFPAIPRTDDDLKPKDRGTSFYPSLAQRVTSPVVLRILLSIGPTETAHFQTWHDEAGNAPPLTDPSNPKLVFPDLNASPFGGEDFQTNLIMPEPCPFLSRKFPVCSIIRPTKTQGAAMGAVRALTADGLFIGAAGCILRAPPDPTSGGNCARRGGD
jgi:hypothetical protein